MSQLNWNVAGDPSGDIPTLIADNPPGGTTLETHFEGIPGQLPNRFIAIVPPSITGGATLYWNKGRCTTRVIVPPGDGSWEAGAPPCLPPELTPEDEALVYGPSSVFLEPLERRGQFYYRGGQPHTVIGASGFRAYERFLRGWDIDAFLDQNQAEGVNALRVWLLNTSVGHILPWEWGDVFYDRLPEFLGYCGARDLDVEFTIGTMWADLLPNVADQQRHWDRVVEAVTDKFCFMEGCNEYDAYPGNRYSPDLKLRKPAGARFDLCSGSNGSDSDALEPVIDSSRYHSNDANEWQRRQAHNPMESGDKYGKPCLANENTRPDRDPNPYKFYDAARGGALLHAGSYIHSNEGKDAVPYGNQTLPCVVQHVAGARSVDLSQRVHGYVHRTDLETDAIIRAYQRGSEIALIRK